MANIVLIGTGHTDPYLTRGVRRALDTLRPDYVTVEHNPTIDPVAETARLKRAVLAGLNIRGRMLNHKELTEFDRILLDAQDQGEWVAATQWSRKYNVPCEGIDFSTDMDTTFQAGVQGMIEQLLPKDSLKYRPSASQTIENQRTTRRKMYEAAKHYLQDRAAGQDLVHRARQRQVIGSRDRAMADRIEQILHSTPVRTLVHIGGAAHMIDDVLHETLYEQLRKYEPQRRLLPDFD